MVLRIIFVPTRDAGRVDDINQYTVKQDWRGLLILRDRSQGLGWEVPYTEFLERRVTQLYLSDLREQQELTPNLMLLQLVVTEKDKSAVIGRKLLQEADTTGEFQRRLMGGKPHW